MNWTGMRLVCIIVICCIVRASALPADWPPTNNELGDDGLPVAVNWVTRLGWIDFDFNLDWCAANWAVAPMIALNGLRTIVLGNTTSLSVQQVTDCAFVNQSGCHLQASQIDTAVESALQYIVRVGEQGICSAAAYPYVQNSSSCQQHTCSGIGGAMSYGLITESPTFQDDLKQLVAQQPVVIGFFATENFELYEGGVFGWSDCPCTTAPPPGAGYITLVVVGYGAVDGVDVWIAMNMWGPNWGVNGAVFIQRGLDFCGMSRRPAYYPLLTIYGGTLPVVTPGVVSVQAESMTSGTVWLEWGAPVDPSGVSAVYWQPSSFIIRADPGAIERNVWPNPDDEGRFSYVFDGLSNGIPYTFSVTAVSVGGKAVRSPASNVVVPSFDAACAAFGGCGVNGVCATTGQCACSAGYTGTQCQGWAPWRWIITIVAPTAAFISALYTLYQWRLKRKEVLQEEAERRGPEGQKLKSLDRDQDVEREVAPHPHADGGAAALAAADEAAADEPAQQQQQQPKRVSINDAGGRRSIAKDDARVGLLQAV